MYSIVAERGLRLDCRLVDGFVLYVQDKTTDYYLLKNPPKKKQCSAYFPYKEEYLSFFGWFLTK